jgi:hypothetical protein
MELYELAMTLSVLLIAAVMDLLDVNSSHTEAARAYPARQARRHRSGPHTKARRVRWRGRARRRPSRRPTPWRHALWIGNGEPPC